MQETIYPAFKEFQRLADKGSLIPVYREIVADLETPVSTYMKLADGKPYSYLLESAEGGEHWGRYSFISWEPKLIFRTRTGEYAATAPGRKPEWKKSDEPLQELKRIMASYIPVEVEGLPRFWGGAVGYASYDVVRYFEHLPDKPEEVLNFPESMFLLTGKLVIFDHLKHSVKIVVCAETGKAKDLKKVYAAAEAEIEKIIRSLRKPLKLKAPQKQKRRPLKSNLRPEEYAAAVMQAKEYIRAGDIIQAVLSQRFSRATKASPLDIYRSLRLVNPSPYMYLFHMGDFDIIGSSPEILVRKEDERAETRPIAGTRPRGRDELHENQLARELLSDPKERAEHIMLVDLGRNDLGRVCQPASVTVPKLMTIEKYSHVMHIVSSVTGKLKAGMDSFELFKACFPAGTLSGAPKVRAMEIIDELEHEARGPYAGAVGYFSYSGNMDMAITIRTIVLKDGTAYAQAGAGIVADSVPENEYKETQNKAAALFSAIDRAEKGLL